MLASASAAGRAFRAAARVGRARRSVTNVPDEWPSPLRLLGRGGTEPGLQTVWQLSPEEHRKNIVRCFKSEYRAPDYMMCLQRTTSEDLASAVLYRIPA